MKTALLWLLLACSPSISVFASDPSILQSFFADLDQNVETLVLQLKTSGYTENSKTSFQQAGVRVFIKTEKGTRPSSFIVEQCGNQITGYTKEITSMESLLLVNELKRQGYKKIGKLNDTYRKGNTTLNFYDDDSRLLLARHYIHVSRKNSCHNDLSSPLASTINLRPTTLEGALSNLKRNRNEIALAAAKIAFRELPGKDADDLVYYQKSQQSFTVKYCNNKVQHLEIELNSNEGNSLVASVEKTNFRKVNENVAPNSAYCRTYENGLYEVKVYYYGDKYGREFNENAYKIELLDKQVCL